jgi:predicted enzyme related to lactoylglutathione lyase
MTVSAHSGGIGTLGAFVLDVNQLETCSLFWSQVLGVGVLFQEENIQGLGREGEPPLMLLQKVAEPRQRKNRAHLDINVTDLEASVKRVQELGGRQLQVHALSEPDLEWVVMAAPEGNEFCLVKHG